VIYPTRLAVWAAVAGAPVTLIVAVLMPGRWYAGLAWPVIVLLLTGLDALQSRGTAKVRVVVPAEVAVGAELFATVSAQIAAQHPPDAAEIAIAVSANLKTEDDGRAPLSLADGRGAAHVPLTALRRGVGVIEEAWVRWRGPLGLAWRQVRLPAPARFLIVPDIRAVSERGAAIIDRHALAGLVAQVDRGDGAEFDALVEYRSGMDRRAIDWKQSARHVKLHAKEYRTERNAQIVFAIDAGRQMSEPVAGLPRVDRAVSAALLTAWVALKLGDRVSLTAFDSRPRLAGGLVGGRGAFAALQRLAAEIDYSGDETNYTFALTTLAARLTRRSMIVLFTEFTDPTSADVLVRAAKRLVASHLLLIVVLRDEELEAIVDHRPGKPEDVTRAVTAAGLLADRRLALARLRHLGVHVIESEHDRVGERLVAGYVDLKRRGLV
jgi:uncharacterized protein (DUF58 family)